MVIYRIVSTDGDTEYWASSNLTTGEPTRRKDAELAWGSRSTIAAASSSAAARPPTGAARAQRNHITRALRAFLRLEQHRTVAGVS